MSRCFPFPPPGYEKKARTGDVDLLKKEKQREKKHKKEKRDKEKREAKEKKEKDRSDEKNREKKDKKEKNRDKKREKDRDKDKEKNSASGEKRPPGQAEGHTGEKPIHKEDRDKDKEKNSASGEKRLPGQAEGHTGEKPLHKEDRDKYKEKNSASGEKRLPGQAEAHTGEKPIHKEDRDKYKHSISDERKFAGHNGEKLSQNSLLAEETKDSKFVQELGRRIKDDGGGGSAKKLVEKNTNLDRKRDEGMVKLVAKGTGTWAEVKEKNKRADDRKMDGQGIRDEARFSGNTMVQNPAGIVQTRVEGMSRSLEKNVERRVEEKEKTKEKEGDDKRGDKRKDKDRQKKNQGKDKDRDKEKKKEEKAKEKIENRNTEQDKLKESNKDNLIGSHPIKTLQLPKDSNKSAAAEENPKKRKSIETNGVLHASDVRPDKLARPASSSHQFTENGRILEPCQTFVTFASDRHGASSNLKLDNKEHKINGVIELQSSSVSSKKPIVATGVIEAQSSSVSSKKPIVATAQADQIVEASAKPPHPDSRYLSQVYTVPKMEDQSDSDDQEWLFSSGSQSKKAKVESSWFEETPQVWAEALRIESADVCALPYVIPY